MTDTTGMLSDAMEITADTAGFKFAQTMQEAKKSLMEIGEIVLPIFTDIVGKVGELVAKFQALSPEQKEQIVKFAGIVAVVGPALFVFGKLVAIIGSIIKFGGILIAVIGGITLPMLAVVAAIAAVIAIGVLLFRNWDTVKEKATETWTSVREAFTSAWKGMKNVARSVGNFIIGYYNAIIGGVERAINAVAGAINGLPSINIPNWVPIFGGNKYSIPTVPQVSFPKIPALAEGGIVRQATLALIGEGGPEAVIPLDRFDQTGGQTVINITVTSADPNAVVEAIRRYTRANGPLGQVITV
jgi:phage-related minor tail protein